MSIIVNYCPWYWLLIAQLSKHGPNLFIRSEFRKRSFGLQSRYHPIAKLPKRLHVHVH